MESLTNYLKTFIKVCTHVMDNCEIKDRTVHEFGYHPVDYYYYQTELGDNQYHFCVYMDANDSDVIDKLVIEEVPKSNNTTYIRSLRMYKTKFEYQTFEDTNLDIRRAIWDFTCSEEELFQQSTIQNYGTITQLDINALKDLFYCVQKMVDAENESE